MTESTITEDLVSVGSQEEAPIRVLHVDDDTGFLRVAKQILEMQGSFEVETTSSVEGALEKMKEKAFDAVVSDYVMPEKSGLDFLKDLRRKGNTIPFIIFTGKGREEVAIKALNFGADHYINKIGKPETVYRHLALGIHQAVERGRAIEELWKREQRLTAILNSSPDIITVSDMQGNIVDCNEAAWKLMGLSSKEELLGKSSFEFIAEKDQKRALENLKKTVEQGTVRNIEYTLLKKDGEEYLGELSASILKDSSGNSIGFVAVVRDITERKQAEKRIAESEENYKRIVELAPDSIITANAKGVITSVNTTFTRLTGFSKDEIIGKHFTKVGTIRKRDFPMFLKLFTSFLRGKAPKPFEVTWKHKDGTTHPTEINVTLVKRDDKTIGFQAITRDITERKQAEKALKETLEKVQTLNEKLEVVGKLTRHDIRNKLQVITSNVYLAKQMLTGDHETLEHLSEIESAVGQVGKIFEFARIYEKLGMEKLAYIDAEKSLKEAVMQFSDLHGAKIVNDCHGLTVLADSLLRQIFYNLIHNSLKHGEKVSRIRVYYEEVGKGKLKLVYDDDGVGIPKAEKKKIFREGYGKGTGYGLYLIGKMCEVYGWTIKETGKEGKGAQFTMSIPKLNEQGIQNYKLD